MTAIPVTHACGHTQLYGHIGFAAADRNGKCTECRRFDEGERPILQVSVNGGTTYVRTNTRLRMEVVRGDYWIQIVGSDRFMSGHSFVWGLSATVYAAAAAGGKFVLASVRTKPTIRRDLPVWSPAYAPFWECESAINALVKRALAKVA